MWYDGVRTIPHLKIIFYIVCILYVCVTRFGFLSFYLSIYLAGNPSWGAPEKTSDEVSMKKKSK